MFTAASWVSRGGSCTFPDGRSKNYFQSVHANGVGGCKALCVENTKCDAFAAESFMSLTTTMDTNCRFYGDTDGLQHSGRATTVWSSWCYMKGAGESATSIPLLPLEQLVNALLLSDWAG